jgi:uncharacterized protein
MKYLIDIGHPAHVHYYKNFTNIMLKKGHEVLFTCRDKEVVISLLEHYKFKYVDFGHPFKSLPGKLFGLFYFTFRLFLISLKFRPHLFLNATMYSAIVAWLMRKPHIGMEDTFNKEQVRLYLPFTSCVLTGNYFHPSLGEKEIRLNGYQELMYLHPDYYKPDKTILQDLGLKDNEAYVILRFISWNASHDVGHKGISLKNKTFAVKEFSKHAKVFISSESEIPAELEQHKIKIPTYKMHDAIAYANLLFGESSTMGEEAAMLGTPAIFLYNESTYYTKHLENSYSLIYNYSESEVDQIRSIEKGLEILRNNKIKEDFLDKRDNMLKGKIDITSFLVWFVENYPESFRIIKENPDYQLRFK